MTPSQNPAESHPSASRSASRSPSSNPNPGQGGREAGSADSSTGSWAASDFLADAGPAFDPERAPVTEFDPEEEGLAVEPGDWDEQRVREFLILQGEITHELLKVGEEDTETWLHTERDLRAIAPPLTRILNRYDATRALAAAGDEALLAAAVVRYGARNYTRRQRLLALQAQAEPQPVTGVPAEPGSGPDDGEEWLYQAPPALVPKGRR